MTRRGATPPRADTRARSSSARCRRRSLHAAIAAPAAGERGSSTTRRRAAARPCRARSPPRARRRRLFAPALAQHHHHADEMQQQQHGDRAVRHLDEHRRTRRRPDCGRTTERSVHATARPGSFAVSPPSATAKIASTAAPKRRARGARGSALHERRSFRRARRRGSPSSPPSRAASSRRASAQPSPTARCPSSP